MIVYKLTNRSNDKAYIGQTVHSLGIRVQGHLAPTSSCRALKNAISRYGIDNFDKEILLWADSLEELNYYESSLIKVFNTMSPNGYNLNSGGDSKRPSEETKLKTRISCLGQKRTDETKRKISLANKGRPGRKKLPEEIEKIRISSTGRGHTPETRKKLSELATLQHLRARGARQ